MKIIDTHTHIFADDLAQRALTALTAELPADNKITPEHNATLNGLLAHLDKYNISKAVALSIATKPQQTPRINQWAIETTKISNRRVLCSGAAHYEYSDLENEFKKLRDNKITVIKLHPEYQYFCPLHSKLEKLFYCAQDYGIKIYFHAGRDIAYLGSRSNPKILSKFIKKYNKLTVIAAHLGSFELWDDTYNYLAGENIYLDTGFTIGYISDEKLLNIIEKHGADKILFATDSPWVDTAKYVSYFKNLPLDDIKKSKILWQNAEKLFWQE